MAVVKKVKLVIKKGKIGDTYLIGGMHEEIDNLKIAKILVKIDSLGFSSFSLNKISSLSFKSVEIAPL